MGESGLFRTAALQGWQRNNVIAAATCLREQILFPESQANRVLGLTRLRIKLDRALEARYRVGVLAAFNQCTSFEEILL